MAETTFEDIPQVLTAREGWENAVITTGSIAGNPIWRITNPSFTDCTITIEQENKPNNPILEMSFDKCSNILLADLAQFIEYPGKIYPDCFPPDFLNYRSIGIVTNDNLKFFDANSVRSFTLYQQYSKSDWVNYLKRRVDDDGSLFWSNKFRYAKITVYEDNCG